MICEIITFTYAYSYFQINLREYQRYARIIMIDYFERPPQAIVHPNDFSIRIGLLNDGWFKLLKVSEHLFKLTENHLKTLPSLEIESPMTITVRLPHNINWNSPKVCRWKWNDDATIDLGTIGSPWKYRKHHIVDDFDLNKSNYPQFHTYVDEHILPRMSPALRIGSETECRGNDKDTDSRRNSFASDNSGGSHHAQSGALIGLSKGDREFFPSFQRCKSLKVLRTLKENDCHMFSDLLENIDEQKEKLMPNIKKVMLNEEAPTSQIEEKLSAQVDFSQSGKIYL